ncbi:MAG: sarcosine oxidase subunit delta [Gammaproteobacteria bacterium]|nr:sarcosine oxidase subunit delta [Gammaproteobacteria bacterium]
MKLMRCPLNGVRNISEFVCGGEVIDMPDPDNCNDREWADYIFMENNTRGVVREWWLHAPTSYWFIAVRDTISNEIIKTYPASEVYNQRIDYPDTQT